MRARYEKPVLTEVGTVQDLTLAANNGSSFDLQFDAATGTIVFGNGGIVS